MYKRRNKLVLALAAASLSTSAWAQNAESTAVIELDDLMVTGSLWESELLDTTASVTVLDDSQFSGNGSQHFENLINSIPNLTWTGGTSRPRYLQIRGIGENSQFEGETPDSSVRFVIDDLDFTGVGTIGSLFDVEQVEVLRGPQAGSFGLNAAGGVIKLVSADPTPYQTGVIETSVGEDNLISGGVAVGGPLAGEELMYRISVHQLNQDGWRDNKTLGRDDTNERDELTTRLKLRWLASDAWTWDSTLFYADADNGYDEWSLGNTGFDVYSDEPGRDEQESLAGSLRGTWQQSEDTTFTTITSLSDSDSYYSYDSDWTVLNEDDFRSYEGFMEIGREREAYSQEFRIDSLAGGAVDRWTVGAYVGLLDETSDIDYRDMWTSPGYEVLADSNYESENFAVFGQVERSLSEKTRLTLGLRSEYYSIEADSAGLYYGTPLPSGHGKESGTVFGGKLTLENDLAENHMLFATVARGYKAGGANIAAFLDEGDPLTYGDETLWNYEIGLRSRWFDGALTSSVTAFYLDRSNAQLRDSAGAGGFFRYFTSNQGDAEHLGLEAETRWLITDYLAINAGVGLLDAEHAVTGRELSNSPSYTYNTGVSYTGHNGIFGSLELNGRDKYFESNSEGNNEQRESYSIVNATIGYEYEGWTFSIWVKNVFDEAYEKRLFYFANTLDEFDYNYDFTDVRRFESPADPRQIGVTARYSF